MEMKQYDKNTMTYYGVPSSVLMERAALAVFQEVKARFPNTCGQVLILCGVGNNGGDGFAVARLMYLAGYSVQIFSPLIESKMTEETTMQYHIVQKYNIPLISKLSQLQGKPQIVIDALFGIGLSRDIEGDLKEILLQLNKLPSYKIAVDIPSGIDSNTGKVLGAAFWADLTVTFGFAKIGQLLYPGTEYCGELRIADIGIDEKSILEEMPSGHYVTQRDISQLLPKRQAYSNKGTYGKTLIIAGSVDMAGAAYFAAKAAYYSGCGLVRIFTPIENRELLLNKLPEAILTTYDASAENAAPMLEQLDQCMDWANAILIGPGLGTSYHAKMLVAKVLQYPGKNIVFDADALNILSNNMTLLKERKCTGIVTPHLGEMSQLMGVSVLELQENLIAAAQEFSTTYNMCCILKDARTVIGTPHGKFYLNTTGNHGMATGGSGDVLAGLVTGFLAQKLSKTTASVLACHLHGMAGDKAAEKKGAVSMLASDILESIPEALQASLTGERM